MGSQSRFPSYEKTLRKTSVEACSCTEVERRKKYKGPATNELCYNVLIPPSRILWETTLSWGKQWQERLPKKRKERKKAKRTLHKLSPFCMIKLISWDPHSTGLNSPIGSHQFKVFLSAFQRVKLSPHRNIWYSTVCLSNLIRLWHKDFCKK